MDQPPGPGSRGSRLRWVGLSLALLLTAFFLAGLKPAVLGWVVSPEARRPGWLVLYQAGENPVAPPLRQAHVPFSSRLELTEPDTSLTAYGLLRVARAGPHRLVLLCDDHGSLHIDGRPLIQLSGVSAANSGEAVVELGEGPHLLRVDLHNGPGRGFFTLELTRPGDPVAGPLRPEEVFYPDLGNLEVWWRVLSQTQDPSPILASALAAGLVWLALPLARGRGWACGPALALVLLAPSVLIFRPPAKFPFEYHHLIQALQKHQPRYVFIGNSMVDSAIDLEHFNRLSRAEASMSLTMGGTRSAVHFLFFKNVLLASGIRPHAVFVFFRDNYLTNPLLRTGAPGDRAVFESLSPGEEPLLRQLVHSRQPWPRRLEEALPGVLRAASLQPVARAATADLALDLAVWKRENPGGQVVREKLRGAVNQRFAVARLRDSVNEALQADSEVFRDPAYDHDLYLDFDRVVDSSFLPHFIALAREHGLRLVFIRHQRRPEASGHPNDDAKLARYMERLGDYLARQGVGFHDFTGDPDLPLELYGAGDHIAEGAAPRYTEVFFDRLRRELSP